MYRGDRQRPFPLLLLLRPAAVCDFLMGVQGQVGHKLCHHSLTLQSISNTLVSSSPP
jgi:hypothetical protein